MLSLPIRTRGELLTAGDDAAADTLYVALSRPRVARRPDGTPRLRLLRWTAATGAGAAPAGGRLTLDVETFPSAGEIAAAGLPSAARPFPWLDAAVRLDGPQFDPIEAEASTALGSRSSLAVDLAPAASAVLAPLLQAGTVAPLQVTWTGHVLVRLPAAEVVATADVREVRRKIEIAGRTTQRTLTRSIIDANARIEIHGAANAAIEQALREWVLDELAARFARGGTLIVRAAAADVVRWPIQLAATLDDLVSPSPGHPLVETAVLDDSAPGRVPAVEVRVLADFTGRLERVDVRLAPAAGGPPAELSCTDDAPARVSLGTLRFRWSRRVKMKGRPAGAWSPWVDAPESSHLLVPVPTPGELRVEVMAVALDFTSRWTAVRVALAHDSPDAAPATHTIELTANRPAAVWTAALDGVRGRVTATALFVPRVGAPVERDLGDVVGNQVVVTDPFDNHRVRVSVVPAGNGWPDAALVMVDLRYVDGGHTFDETVELRALEDFVEWEAPARPDGPREIQWRQHASSRSGDFQSTGWQTAPAGVVVVRLDGVPRREVQILPIYFDPSVARKGTLRLRSGSAVEIVEVTSRAARTVSISPGPFTWTVAWTTPNGEERPESSPLAGDDVIVVPRFEVQR
jgi:hypothetical protein